MQIAEMPFEIGDGQGFKGGRIGENTKNKKSVFKGFFCGLGSDIMNRHILL